MSENRKLLPILIGQFDEQEDAVIGLFCLLDNLIFVNKVVRLPVNQFWLLIKDIINKESYEKIKNSDIIEDRIKFLMTELKPSIIIKQPSSIMLNNIDELKKHYNDIFNGHFSEKIINKLFSDSWYIDEDGTITWGVISQWQLHHIKLWLDSQIDDFKLAVYQDWMAAIREEILSNDSVQHIQEWLGRINNLTERLEFNLLNFKYDFAFDAVPKPFEYVLDFTVIQLKNLERKLLLHRNTQHINQQEFITREESKLIDDGEEQIHKSANQRRSNVSYRWLGEVEQLEALYYALCEHHINDTTLDDFKAVFSNQPFSSFKPVRWASDNASELIYFIISVSKLGNKRRDNNDWVRLSNCFVRPDGSQFNRASFKSLYQAIGRDLSQQKRASIDRLLLPFK